MMVEVGMMTCHRCRYCRCRSCYCRVGGGVREQHVPTPQHHSAASVADHYHSASLVATRGHALLHDAARDDEVDAGADVDSRAKTGYW